MLPLLEGIPNLSGEAQRKMRRHLPVIEPIAVPDVYVSGVLPKEELGGGLFRVTAYAIQRCSDGTDCAVIVSRHIVCADDMAESIASLMEPERVLLAS
jgi:hypothetical protein